MIVLGLDTGLAALGWALVDIGPTTVANGLTVEVIDAGVWTTSKETKRRQLHVGSDDARRIDFLADRILEAITTTDESRSPRLCAYELPAAAKGSRAAHALGIGHALIRTCMRACTAMPVVEVTARDVKTITAGDPNASKDAMIAAAAVRWPALLDLRKGDHEHAADAIGVALAGAATTIGRAMLGRRAA